MDSIKNDIEGIIESVGTYRSPYQVAQRSAERILADYVVIPKSSIPPISDSRVANSNLIISGQSAVATYTTVAQVQQHAYEHLALAQELKRIDEEDKLKKEKAVKIREDVIKEVFPNAYLSFSYENLDVIARPLVDKIVKLKQELTEAKSTK